MNFCSNKGAVKSSGAQSSGRAWAGSSASSPSLGMAPTQPTFLTSEGKQPPELCKFPRFSGRLQCKIRKDLSLLSDPRHDKISASANFCTRWVAIICTSGAVRCPPTHFKKDLKSQGGQIHKIKHAGSKRSSQTYITSCLGFTLKRQNSRNHSSETISCYN